MLNRTIYGIEYRSSAMCPEPPGPCKCVEAPAANGSTFLCDPWAANPFPFGSEFAWDSTGQEEIYVWSKYASRCALSPCLVLEASTRCHIWLDIYSQCLSEQRTTHLPLLYDPSSPVVRSILPCSKNHPALLKVLSSHDACLAIHSIAHCMVGLQ